MLIFSSLKQDYKLRLVGHSLGGASAALLAIMLRKKSKEELGFNPDIISAVGFGTPPCISKEAAESCASYVSTIVLQVMLNLFVGFKSGSCCLPSLSCLSFVIGLFLHLMQDDIIPRLSAASLARLRNEILKTDW